MHIENEREIKGKEREAKSLKRTKRSGINLSVCNRDYESEEKHWKKRIKDFLKIYWDKRLNG